MKRNSYFWRIHIAIELQFRENTESWSHGRARLCDWVVRPVGASCYSWAALSLIYSKTRYILLLNFKCYLRRSSDSPDSRYFSLETGIYQFLSKVIPLHFVLHYLYLACNNNMNQKIKAITSPLHSLCFPMTAWVISKTAIIGCEYSAYRI